MPFPDVEHPFREGLFEKLVNIVIPQAPLPPPPKPQKGYWVWSIAGGSFPGDDPLHPEKETANWGTTNITDDEVPGAIEHGHPLAVLFHPGVGAGYYDDQGVANAVAAFLSAEEAPRTVFITDIPIKP